MDKTMTDEQIKNKLTEITSQVQQLDSLPENCGLIFLYCDGERIKPCIMGNGRVLPVMLASTAMATDDFRGVLTGAVEVLKEKGVL